MVQGHETSLSIHVWSMVEVEDFQGLSQSELHCLDPSHCTYKIQQHHLASACVCVCAYVLVC